MLIDCSIVLKSSEEAIRNPGDYYLNGVRSKRRDSITAWNGNRPGARLRPPDYGSLRRLPLGNDTITGWNHRTSWSQVLAGVGMR